MIYRETFFQHILFGYKYNICLLQVFIILALFQHICIKNRIVVPRTLRACASVSTLNFNIIRFPVLIGGKYIKFHGMPDNSLKFLLNLNRMNRQIVSFQYYTEQ